MYVCAKITGVTNTEVERLINRYREKGTDEYSIDLASTCKTIDDAMNVITGLKVSKRALVRFQGAYVALLYPLDGGWLAVGYGIVEEEVRMAYSGDESSWFNICSQSYVRSNLSTLLLDLDIILFNTLKFIIGETDYSDLLQDPFETHRFASHVGFIANNKSQVFALKEGLRYLQNHRTNVYSQLVLADMINTGLTAAAAERLTASLKLELSLSDIE